MTTAELREELAAARKRRDTLVWLEAFADERGAPVEILDWIGTQLLKAEEEVKYARNECDFRAGGWEAVPRAYL